MIINTQNKCIKFFFAIISLYLLIKFYHNVFDKNNKYIINYIYSSQIVNITNLTNIYIIATNISYYFSFDYQLVKIKYFVRLMDKNNNIIKPSDLSFIYSLHFLCNIYIYESKENIYSFANIYQNKFFFCTEYINITEHIKFGIKICKIDEDIEYEEHYFFSEKLFINRLNYQFKNNHIFDIFYLKKKYIKLLSKIIESKKTNEFYNETYKLKFSFLKPPINYLKKEITKSKGDWFFENLFDNYFCFCMGRSCIKKNIFYNDKTNICKYYFYLSIIDDNRNVYRKTNYLLADFFKENAESADAFPIFKEMIKQNLTAYYLTVSKEIYDEFCSNDLNCNKDMPILYGIRKIDGGILEKYLELFLKLKVVIAVTSYNCIDNLFYNIEYITFIFLGHGVTYVKSFLYNNYFSCKKYNKILIPPSEKFIKLALEAGWKPENLIKMSLPRWDNYFIHKINKKKNRSIFVMFTWRQIKNGQKMSDLYYTNIYNLFSNPIINEQLQKNNIILYYTFHHRAKAKRLIKDNRNIKILNQKEISSLLKNSSLIITDFSSILFDAIVQKKPLILFIPDGLDNNLKEIYEKEYYETILKLKNGTIYLYELFLNINDVINKIVYYIKNDFSLEYKKLEFYNQFNLDNQNNTIKFINYLKKLK